MTSMSQSYLMENLEESIRLEMKTQPEVVRKQAHWCGLKPRMRVLDVGCGPGKTSRILHQMIQPGGELLGLDFSRERIDYAERHYGGKRGLHFRVHDMTKPLDSFGRFDLVWVRFFLEYHRSEGIEIARNLSECLKPGGFLCLMDLDHNCLNHYEMTPEMQNILYEIVSVLEKERNFDPYAGRKLYAYLYDLGFEDIEMELMAHHLFYGEIGGADVFNWIKKAEVISEKVHKILMKYPGGRDQALAHFMQFLNNPRRFTYTPLIMCKGRKPLATEDSRTKSP